MQFIVLLFTIAFVFHPHVSRCAPLPQTVGNGVAVAQNTTQLVGPLHLSLAVV